jgi:serine/threonine protein kinase
MPLTPGTRLGPYEIIEPLGAGGMGEVYKARDPRLDRTVAIKVSAAQFSERFEREARAVAALNHPHICQLYDVGPDYLVLEFIEGSPLKGPLPTEQATTLALQMLSALDAAHRKGIVHRDLKPANILLTKAGIKLLDFGLAKQHDTSTGNTAEQTVTLHLTAAHTVLGTPQYMAPEQIEGRDADPRTDIFAFGCVFYELLTGRKAFEGKSPSTVMASVLATEPPAISSVQPGAVTPALERVVKTCLAKDPDERWQSARELQHAILWAVKEIPPPATVRRRQWIPWAIAAALALAAPAAWLLHPKAPEPSAVRLELSPPENTAFSSLGMYWLAISPDGKHLVYVGTGSDHRPGLWLRSLHSAATVRLPDTEGAGSPFWSPDSRWIGFSAGNRLSKVDINGGPVQIICDLGSAANLGTWNRDGVIVFEDSNRILYRVPASGGKPTKLFPLDAARGESMQRDPQFLPDGRHFLYASNAKKSVTVLASLDGERRVLMDQNESPAYYAPSASGGGYLLFIRRRQLVAQPFDAAKGILKGEPQPIAEGLGNGPSFSASANGVVTFRTARGTDNQLTWFDREGKPLGTAGDPGHVVGPRISPDGKTIAFYRYEGGNSAIWLFDTERSNSIRFTVDASMNLAAAWSGDGSNLFYHSRRGADRFVLQQPASGIGKETVLRQGSDSRLPEFASRDGRWLVLRSLHDLYLLPLAGDAPLKRDPIPFPRPAAQDRDGSISADSRWFLYSSIQSGRRDIFVRSMPDAGVQGRWQISKDGGAQPIWRADGKEILFVSSDGRMMSVPIESGPAVFKPGVPKALFQTRLHQDTARDYDVTSDGKRFIVAEPLSGGGSIPITVILNWPELLQR